MHNAATMDSNDQQKKDTNTVESSTGMFKPTDDRVDVFGKWKNLKDTNNKKSVTCNLCHKTSIRGITRAKRHQLNIIRDVISCRKVSEDVKLEMQEAFNKKKLIWRHTWSLHKKKTKKRKITFKRLQDLEKIEKGLQYHQVKALQLLPRRGPQIIKALLIICSPKT